MKCRACQLDHAPTMRCEMARRLEQKVVHTPSHVVVHAEKVVHIPSALVVHTSKHGKYADAEKRKAYRREWMRKKRANAG